MPVPQDGSSQPHFGAISKHFTGTVSHNKKLTNIFNPTTQHLNKNFKNHPIFLELHFKSTQCLRFGSKRPAPNDTAAAAPWPAAIDRPPRRRPVTLPAAADPAADWSPRLRKDTRPRDMMAGYIGYA